MKTFPTEIKFKYPWRKYQQRVLDELEDHLADRHLHVVAPPGSGKTVLGLEVMLRLNKPTLILAPTLAIRNQWIQRFCELFLQVKHCPAWISKDIKKPGLLTVSTYQGMHAACSGDPMFEEEADEAGDSLEDNEDTETTLPEKSAIIAKRLSDTGIEVIIADEAHHLKNEWWATLTGIKRALDPVVVGLTATPPFDVSVAEWQRYIELTGPVDAEISVPELMLENDLCPHQDLVYFTKPNIDEEARLNRFRTDAGQLFHEIKNDPTLVSAITKHPALTAPLDRLEWIYTNMPYYCACLIFLKTNGHEIPQGHIDIIGDKTLVLPVFDYHWLELLLEFYLFKDNENFKAYKDHRAAIVQQLKLSGLLERRVISLTQNPQLTGMLSSSVSKLDAIKEIVDHEYAKMGEGLKLVILCDFIRKEFLSAAGENNIVLNKTGVIPAFEQLRRHNSAAKSIAVLTGSLVILPVTTLEMFRSIAAEYGVARVDLMPIAYDHDFAMIIPDGRLSDEMIHIVTRVFESGAIRVLIGTRSLLGEGWDAPSINTLILASFVGSFVLSNQMRGRAIRTLKDNKDKTANIWHLVCIDPATEGGGTDMELLKRRFRAFVGISLTGEPTITNGIARLKLSEDIGSGDHISEINIGMLAGSAQRSAITGRWQDALKTGVQLVEEIKIPFRDHRPYQQVKEFYFTNTLWYFLASLLFGFGEYLFMFFQNAGRIAQNINTPTQLYVFLSLITGLALLLFAGKAYRAFRMYVRYRDIGKDLHDVAEVLMQTLVHGGFIKTPVVKLRVDTIADRMGGVSCHLEGGTNFEKSLFVNSLMEIVGPIYNPRFVIIRRDKMLGFIKRDDYHAVPEIIGRSKTVAEYFANEWHRKVGNNELIFTRNPEGRKLLLRFRINSLAAQFEPPAEHQSRWSY